MLNINLYMQMDLAVLDNVEPGHHAEHLAFDYVELEKPTGIFFYDNRNKIIAMIPWTNVNIVKLNNG